VRRFATPTRLFVAGFLLLQVAWIIVLPPFAGIDEFDHAYRADAVASGGWLSDRAPTDGRGMLVAVSPDLVAAAHEQCELLRYTGPDNCNPAGPAPEGRVLIASGASSYYPVFYWVVGTAAGPFAGATALYVMRVVAALLCATLVGMAAWSATRGPSPWPVVGLLVALTPVLVYSTVVVAPNGLELAAGVALWTSLLQLRVETDPRTQRRLLNIAVLSAVVMCSLRLLGPLWVLLVVATIVLFDRRSAVEVVRRYRHVIVTGAALVAVAVGCFATWTLRARSVAVSSGGADPVEESLSPLHVVLWAMQSIAAFPYRNQAGPAIVYAVVGALALSLAALAVRVGSGARRRVVVASFAAALLLPLAATLATYDGGEIIWQGRYGLPFGVGFVLLSAWLVAETSRLPLTRGAVLAGAAAYVVAVAWSLLKVRQSELREPASVGDPAWLEPSPVVLTGLVVAAMAAWTGAVIGAATTAHRSAGVALDAP
jgi:hypothetical protein